MAPHARWVVGLAIVLSAAPRAPAQPAITGADSNALAAVIAERLRIAVRGNASGTPFVLAGIRATSADSLWAGRVARAVARQDSQMIAVRPTRLTRRVGVGAVRFMGDSVSVSISIGACQDGAREWYSVSEWSETFRRERDVWAYQTPVRFEVNVGDSPRCPLARDADQYAPLAARDSTELFALVVADMRGTYTVFRDGVFVPDTSRMPIRAFSARMLAALRRGDTAAKSAPTRNTPRVWLGDLVHTGDTVTVSVTVNQCADGPPIRYFGTGSAHRYYRVGDRWERIVQRASEVGHGARCPW